VTSDTSSRLPAAPLPQEKEEDMQATLLRVTLVLAALAALWMLVGAPIRGY